MNIERVIVGELRTNCWIIEGVPETEDTGAPAPTPVIVIDPGDEADKILDALRGRPVAGVLLTHGHFDHLGAADEVADETASFLYLSEPEAEVIAEGLADSRTRYQIEVDVPRIDYKVNEGDVLQLAGLRIGVMLTPGHSPGSVGYLIPEPENARIHYFSGDTLFARDIGRTDFLGGDAQAMETSLARIAKLPPDTAIYPGHGPATTIAREAAANSWWPA